MTLERTPDYLAIAEAVTQQSNWKEALDSVIAVIRSVFLFDNLALFLREEEGQEDLNRIVYARAVGRGKTAGADAAWGAEIANEVLEHGEMVIQTEDTKIKDEKSNRLLSPYLIGLPLRYAAGLVGAAVFVRFGGPAYTPEQIQRAQFIATQLSSLFERKKLREQILALQEARRVIALQEDFIATISHELRTPLGFIKGYSTTLLRQDTEWDDETRREFLTIIDEEADHLSSLIENILESARLQSDTLPMNFQPIRLDTVIRDVALRSQVRYNNMEVELDLAPCPPISADGGRLAQVLDNLFSNAAKYAPGSSVSLTLRNQADSQCIRFSDHGPGIPADHIVHLFERFYRIPGQAAHGSGLGLFICRKIIEAHGGTMLVESDHGKGTSFIITIPARENI